MNISLVSIMFGLLCCTTETNDTALEDTATAPQAWSSLLVDDQRGLVMSIWEAGALDIWAVGGQTESGLLIRCQTQACLVEDWEEISLPQGTPLLNWIHGTDAENVWVGGIDGTLLFWNGIEWIDYSIDMAEAIWGIHAQSDRVVVVGGQSRWGGEKAFIKSKQGDSFVDLDIPEVYSDVQNLFKVTMLNENVWIVGAQGVLMHCMEECQPIPTGMASDLITITSDSESIHLVGGRGTGIYAPVSEAGMGEVMQVPAGLNGVSAAQEDILVVGERGYSGIITDGMFNEIPSVTLDVLHAALIDSQGRMFAVGGNLFTAEPTFHGVVLMMEQP